MYLLKIIIHYIVLNVLNIKSHEILRRICKVSGYFYRRELIQEL